MKKITLTKCSVAFLATLFLFSNVFAYGISPGKKNFDVIANKTYTDDFCIINTIENQTYYIYHNEPSHFLFEEFFLEHENITSSKNGERLCIDFTFKIKNPKNIDSDNHQMTLFVSKSNPDSSGFTQYATAFKININSISIGYENAFLKLSSKFLIFFISLFSVFGLLLYMIKNKKINE